MKNLLIALPIILIPSLAFAGLDFTPTVQNNAMLILFLISIVSVVAAGIGKILWDSIQKKLDGQTVKAQEKEDEAYKAEMKLKEQEISQIKVRVDRIELEQNVCSRNLPMTYVTRQEYDKFVLQHREEFASIMNRMEGMIKEFKNDIKVDMQDQIDRLVDVIGRLIKEKE